LALPDKLTLEITTPERLVLTVDADEVVLPSTEGSMGALPGHAALLAALEAGEVSYRVGSDRKFLAVSGGFAEVLSDRVQILAQSCESAEEIDVDRARKAETRAQERLDSHQDDIDLARARASLSRAHCRIEIGSRAR
jgi:F-type H+-transporting ATPase subunit epsilon